MTNIKGSKTQNEESATGLILEIQRMSTEDGPGLRTTVFFKGCSLKCTWCHNPESIRRHPEIQWVGSRCIGCRTCIESCPNNALTLRPDGIHIDRRQCDNCGICTDECPSTAMEMLGETWQLDDLAHEIAKDQVYFEKSGGGVTVSGGEPTLQAPFASALLKRLKAEKIETALDTCGLCSRQQLDLILPHTDLVLFDLKTIDSEKHRLLTGSSNQKILDNLTYIARLMERQGYPGSLWIRTPVIPGATDTAENISAIGKWVAGHLESRVDRWELCAFNNLCRDKYTRLGIDWPFYNMGLLEKARIEGLADIAKKSDVDPGIIFWSGSTVIEEDTTDLSRQASERRLEAERYGNE